MYSLFNVRYQCWQGFAKKRNTSDTNSFIFFIWMVMLVLLSLCHGQLILLQFLKTL